ncbi:FAD-dependent oxidoreductase [Synechococcus sp. M16CYN]|uniref:glycerol-3-phosphate dehydrogenase/oxidase n=1 Tax=Synechococcus sp. M16CYN TaxID=3103139 RepID=UPI0032513F91
MADHTTDLLVVGAGASGASVAYEAVRRGLSVALLEAGDIGGGTSSRSTKLLHGGVRYLELAFKTFNPAQLKLVKEALIERSHWLKQAPFLARRLTLALPTDNVWGQAYYRIGLGIYDALAGHQGIGSSHLLSRRQLRQALPKLKPCQGAVAYNDGQFDDARLNLLLALTAQRAGVVLRTRCKVMAIERNSVGRVAAAISETINGQQERWNARVIVNAAGPGADTLRHMADPTAPARMLTSRGSHIVLKQNLCQQGLGLLVPSTVDGRVLFMLPFFGRTLVGTTDEVCELGTANVPSSEEEAYLLNYVHQWFPSVTKPEVTSRWAGGRPLLRPSRAGIDKNRIVRDHEVETLPCGLVSVMGGKWTTCRPMAIDTLAAVERQRGRPLPPAKALSLWGSGATVATTYRLLKEQVAQLKALLPDTFSRSAQIAHLQSNYGLQALPLIEAAAPADREPLSDVIPLCEAEVSYAIRAEQARSSTDVLARRCRLAMVDLTEAQRLEPVIEKHLAQSGLATTFASPIDHQLNP